MKNIVSNTTFIIVAIGLLLGSCSKDRIEEDDFGPMDDFYNEHKQEEQVFVIDSGGTGPIIGKEGTKLYVSKDIFMHQNGDDVDWPYTIKLVELYTAKDIILWNMPSVANGEVMETAGEIRVRAFKGSEELVLKPGRKYVMELDSMQNLKTGMQVYYGFDKSTYVDWTNDVTTISTLVTNDTLSSVTVGTDFYTLGVAHMGWVNCGKLFSSSSTTTVTFSVEGTNTQYIDIFVVFDNFKSVAQVYNLASGQLPVGENVRIIAMAMNQNKSFVLHNETITISSGKTVGLTMNEVSETNLLNTLGGL